MRLSQFEILDGEVILDIFNNTQYCHIAMIDDYRPYIVTMFYAYQPSMKRIYIHGAMEGRKADILNRGPANVCVQIINDVEMIPDDAPCDYFSAYSSIVADGVARLIESDEEKLLALNLITKKYAGLDAFPYPEEMIQATSCWCIELLAIKGKKIPKS